MENMTSQHFIEPSAVSEVHLRQESISSPNFVFSGCEVQNEEVVEVENSLISDETHSQSGELIAARTSKPMLEIGTFNIRLHIPGLFDILAPITPSSEKEAHKWLWDFYKTFKGKYWKKYYQAGYECLVCERKFQVRGTVLTHLNRHLGFYVARCTNCSKPFYSLMWARLHIKKCFARKIK